MDYSTSDLPQSCVDAACVQANFVTRNARYRDAVCEFLSLQWISVGGNGNCFFESVIILLREAGRLPDNLNAHQLRLDLVSFFRACCQIAEDIFERIVIEIEAELLEKLVCSTRGKINGIKIDGHMPVSRENYFDAVAIDGVWAQGWHWLRAVSVIYDVRVAVVVFGHPIVRFFGEGPVTIHLYKVDAESHFDPLVPRDPAVIPFLPNKRASSISTDIAHVSESDEGDVHFQTNAVSITNRRLRGTARMQTHPNSESVHSSPSIDTDSGDDAVPKRRHAKKVTSKGSDSDASIDMPLCELSAGTRFTARDQRVAKNIILASFKGIHVNGWCVCNNSR